MVVVGDVSTGVGFGDYLWEIIGRSLGEFFLLFVDYGIGTKSKEEEGA